MTFLCIPMHSAHKRVTLRRGHEWVRETSGKLLMKNHISPRKMSNFIRGKLPKNFLCAPDKEMMKRSFPPRLLSRSDKRAGNIFLLFIFPGQETNFHPSAFSTTHFLTLITFNHDITTFLRNAHQHHTHPSSPDLKTYAAQTTSQN